MQLAKRAGMSKAKVALARKLAVILHRMLVEGKPFNPTQQQPNKERITVFGRVTTPAFPKRSPFAGTMDQVRPCPPCSFVTTHP